MKNILIIGPNFYYFTESVANAFRKLGYEANVCKYDSPIHPYNLINRIRYKVSRNRNRLKEKSRSFFSEYVWKMYEKHNPNTVFIINGDGLQSSVVKKFGENSTVAIWMFDSVSKYPTMKDNLPYANTVFCYEYSDIERIKNECGIDAFFLPQAADVDLYFKLPDRRILYDIVFAGDIWQSSKRQRILRKVIERFPDKRILIWGVYKPWYKGVWTFFTREHKEIYMNKNTTPEILNYCYNHARVVLNIHNEQQTDGANPKVFEISASGAYQICDSNPFIEHLFDKGEIGLYHTDEECLELIETTFESVPNAERAYEKIINEHTFGKRIAQVLEIITQTGGVQYENKK